MIRRCLPVEPGVNPSGSAPGRQWAGLLTDNGLRWGDKKMRFLNKMGLGKKLGLLLLLPLSSMSFFIYQKVDSGLYLVEDARAIKTLPGYLDALSGVIHELQKERGNSAGFINAEGRKFGPELDAQRKLTDGALNKLKATHAELKETTKPEIVVGVDDLLSRMEEIPDTRSRVSAQSLNAGRVLQFYTGLITGILDEIGATTKLASSGKVAGDVSGYHAILNMKEAAGIERALIAGSFASQSLPQARFERILSLAAVQSANAANFLSAALPEQRELFEQVLASDGYSRALAVREAVLSVGRGQQNVSTLNRDPVEVFSGQSVKLEELRRVEDKLGEDLITLASAQETQAWSAVTWAVIEGAIAFCATLFLAILLVRGIVSKISDAASAAVRVGEGNLTMPIDSKGDDEIGQLLSGLSTTQDRLTGVIHDIQMASQDLDSGVNEIAAGNQDLSERTQQQASSLDEITKKMQELSEVVSNSTRQQVEGDQLAKQALELTTGCSDMVRQLYLSMQEIRESSKNIMTITSVIDEIAFQTNLLSLNAAVEAARAGEQGKGFAVVAAEVRQLAQRSSSAASEINDLIDNGVEKVNKGGDLAETARNALNDVQASVRSVSEVMRDLSSNSQAQADDIGEISGMVAEIDGVTQRNAALVEEVAAASETLGQNSAELSKVTKYFQLKG